MKIPPKAKQLRYRLTHGVGYVPIQRNAQRQRISCPICTSINHHHDDVEIKIDFNHISHGCSRAALVKHIFVNQIVHNSLQHIIESNDNDSITLVSQLDWNLIWDNDLFPTKSQINICPTLHALDYLMTLIKFELWSKFTSYMYGDKPNIFIEPTSLVHICLMRLKAIGRMHPKAIDIDLDNSGDFIKCPSGWEQVVKQTIR